MTLLITYILIAIGFSFLCSILEAVLLSVTPSYVQTLLDERPKVGKVLKGLKDDVDRPLASILILNTIAHTVGAAGAGAQAQAIWGSEVLAVASAILTVLIVVFSEIIPKTVGATYWRRLAPVTARILPMLMLALFPFVWASEKITHLLKPSEDISEKISREEIAALAKLGEEQGVFAESESRILRNLFRFGDVTTGEIMTPRTVMFALQADTTVEEAMATEGISVFSRIPIYGENRDDIIGFILKDELYLRAAKDELSLKVSDFKRRIPSVPENTNVATLFENLLGNRSHISLVVDEYGGADGVVTMEDILETLLGQEIVDEADATEDMREKARAQYEKRAEEMGTVPPPAMPES